MSLLEILGLNRKKSADIAKERLQIIVAHQRQANDKQHVNLQQLQRKLITVIADHLKIAEERVSIELEKDQQREVLELNVTFPDKPLEE